ncbi:hypothetical protein ALC56_04323, partial [Trachymyrmex septentrionalis]
LRLGLGCFRRIAFVEINPTRAYKSGFKLATVRGPSGTESGELRRIGFLSPNIFHVRANFGEVNLAVRGGDKTAVRRRRAIRREIYEVQAVPCESVGVMHVGFAWRVIARVRCPRLINRATVRLNTGDVIIRGFMRRCARNFLNNLWLWSFLLRSKPYRLQSTLVNVSRCIDNPKEESTMEYERKRFWTLKETN